MSERDWTGHRLDDLAGAKIGRIEGVIGGEGGDPRWLRTKTGRFGQSTVVPAADAVEGADCVWVPYPRELIRAAPRVGDEARLDAGAERSLRKHYGLR